jgi:hypothetical protein
VTSSEPVAAARRNRSVLHAIWAAAWSLVAGFTVGAADEALGIPVMPALVFAVVFAAIAIATHAFGSWIERRSRASWFRLRAFPWTAPPLAALVPEVFG